jgi:hypothetical protein
MAHKENSRKAIQRLFRGEIDLNSNIGNEILQEIAERIFKERLSAGPEEFLTRMQFAF